MPAIELHQEAVGDAHPAHLLGERRARQTSNTPVELTSVCTRKPGAEDLHRSVRRHRHQEPFGDRGAVHHDQRTYNRRVQTGYCGDRLCVRGDLLYLNVAVFRPAAHPLVHEPCGPGAAPRLRVQHDHRRPARAYEHVVQIEPAPNSPHSSSVLLAVVTNLAAATTLVEDHNQMLRKRNAAQRRPVAVTLHGVTRSLPLLWRHSGSLEARHPMLIR